MNIRPRHVAVKYNRPIQQEYLQRSYNLIYNYAELKLQGLQAVVLI